MQNIASIYFIAISQNCWLIFDKKTISRRYFCIFLRKPIDLTSILFLKLWIQNEVLIRFVLHVVVLAILWNWDHHYLFKAISKRNREHISKGKKSTKHLHIMQITKKKQWMEGEKRITLKSNCTYRLVEEEVLLCNRNEGNEYLYQCSIHFANAFTFTK